MSYMKMTLSTTSSTASIVSDICIFRLNIKRVNRFHSVFNPNKNNVQLNYFVRIRSLIIVAFNFSYYGIS